VIGLVQAGEQAWADRYAYLPSIGLFVAALWSIKVRETRRIGALVSAILTGSILLTLASIQLRYWKSTRTLFEHAAAVTHNNHMAVTLLGSLYAKEGKLEEAIERYKTALRWKPEYPEAHFFLGNALDQQGHLDEAIAEYQKALGYKPIQEQTHIYLGAALAKQQKPEEATSHYLEALKINPESAAAHNNLAKVLQTKGKLDDAMEHYVAALKFEPGLAQAHNNLGVLLLARGRTAEGASELREALRLNPGDLESEFNLGLALSQQRQWLEAAELFGKALEKRGNDANAHYQFAVALIHLQKTREAMRHYASALLIQPDFPDALDGLAWILAAAQNSNFRNGTEAVRMAERACDLVGRKDAQKLRTLAAAYAEAGRFNEAVTAMQSAIEIASRAGSSSLKDGQSMVDAFNASKPWRDPQLK
jgi:tetratricopeptide (TPR) repeat protein